jgi:hypothetical protein
MVILLLLLPLAVCGALLALEFALPLELLATLSHSALIYSLLSLAVLAAILAAAWRRRANVVLLSAWLFLFCGVLLFSVSELVEFLLPEGQAWVVEVFEAASFFPLALAVAYMAAPLRILILPARRRAVHLLIGAALLVIVALVVLLPWLLLSSRGAMGSPSARTLRLVKPLLDALLVEPLGLLILVLGVSSGRNPFVLIGVGLLFALPSDILNSHSLFGRGMLQEQLAYLFAFASQLYILAGALLCALTRPGGRKSGVGNSLPPQERGRQ